MFIVGMKDTNSPGMVSGMVKQTRSWRAGVLAEFSSSPDKTAGSLGLSLPMPEIASHHRPF